MAGPIIPAGDLIIPAPLIAPVPRQPVRLVIKYAEGQEEGRMEEINRIAGCALPNFQNAVAAKFNIKVESLALLHGGELIETNEKFVLIRPDSPIFGVAKHIDFQEPEPIEI